MKKLTCGKCPNLRRQNHYTQSGNRIIWSHRCAVSDYVVTEHKGFKGTPDGIKTPKNCPNKIKEACYG